MNELEVRIRQWRQQMNSEARFQADEVAELENHLRESIVQLIQSGLESEEAFLVAAHRLGTYQTLGAAYDENRTLIEHLLRPSRSVAMLALIVALLTTVWVLRTSYVIADVVGGEDTMVVLARQGAEVRIASDGLYVEAGEAGMIARSIIPRLAYPFGLLSLLSFLGWMAVWHRSASPKMAIGSA